MNRFFKRAENKQEISDKNTTLRTTNLPLLNDALKQEQIEAQIDIEKDLACEARKELVPR